MLEIEKTIFEMEAYREVQLSKFTKEQLSRIENNADEIYKAVFGSLPPESKVEVDASSIYQRACL